MTKPTTEFTMLRNQLEHLVTEHEDLKEHWMAFSSTQDKRIEQLEDMMRRAAEILRRPGDVGCIGKALMLLGDTPCKTRETISPG